MSAGIVKGPSYISLLLSRRGRRRRGGKPFAGNTSFKDVHAAVDPPNPQLAAKSTVERTELLVNIERTQKPNVESLCLKDNQIEFQGLVSAASILMYQDFRS